ncbi:MAG: sensor histidine kinase [Candidatus Sulfotelmatobacter sp.]
MGLLHRHRWFVAAAGITLAFAAVSLTAHRSLALTAFADIAGLVAMMMAGAITLANATRAPGQGRRFWALMTLGFAVWAANQTSWIYWELLRRRAYPDVSFFDVVLFFHLVPLIAATAWRPDLPKDEARLRLRTLNFFMLLGWWIFLYAFLVFPDQYVVTNLDRYVVYYDRLYLAENALLATALALAALTSSGGWRRLYLHFLGASLLYGVGSQFLDRASAKNIYYSGSLYDLPLIGTITWMAAASLAARDWQLQSMPPRIRAPWRNLAQRLAMLAMLSLPALGLWAVLFDHSPVPSRVFRIFAVLAAMLLLGAFVFLRQYLQDQALMGVLQESRRSYDSQMRLQKHLVQKEKLASLGTLVAGAAHEINHPLTAIMSYSEQLWTQEQLTDEQKSLLRKIVTQAQRTRDLVVNLLSFAQQSPGEKVLVNLNVLLNRAAQMLESRHPGGNIRLSLSIAPDFPRVQGNTNQLFQVFVEIIENAMDALQEIGGGSLEIIAQKQGNEAMLQFSDTGSGVREPERVFDPFYTTKPVGKGTGLGLSVVYGFIQDHGGQITCQNKPEGGALFVVRFPAAAEPAAHVAGAAGH